MVVGMPRLDLTVAFGCQGPGRGADSPCMWLITTRGFYSVVEHRSDPERLIVRARRREDLEALAELIPDLEIFSDRRADYRWRAVVSRSEWVVALALLAGEIDYPNFKNAVAKRQGEERARCYSEIWRILYALQQDQDG